MSRIAAILSAQPAPAPLPRQGDLLPAFLGLLPTRGCNLACLYCGFLTPDGAGQAMDLRLARDAVEWYMNLVGRSGRRTAEIHFFGGEPFCVEEVLDLTVRLARIRAEEVGCRVKFEVATNGVFSEKRARWAADNLDTIVLSLDGPADIQNRHRPYRNGRGSFEMVDRSARLLSGGYADLCFRVCVTDQTVSRLPEIAAWLCQDYRPRHVCFEAVQPAAHPEGRRLEPPDPWEFAYNFIQAARVLEAHGVEPVYAAADISSRQVTFCPVGQDAAIVSPDGTINACYLLRRDWEARGLDLRLGRIDEQGRVELDEASIARVRDLNVWNKPFCARCFCKWHCAGGCHVAHGLPDAPGDYDRLCLQTRIIALRNILKAMDREDLMCQHLADPAGLERAICQTSDVLVDREDRS